MTHIKIIRFEPGDNNPHGYQGAVEPHDKTWQLAIDAEGLPHLFIAAKVDGGDGWMDVDDLLPGDLTIGALVGAEAGEPVSDEEAEAFAAELRANGKLSHCPPL